MFIPRLGRSSFSTKTWQSVHFPHDNRPLPLPDNFPHDNCPFIFQLFLTCTAAEAAVLGFDDVAFSDHHPVHITALGSTDTAGKQELETALVAVSDVCAYDNAQQTRDRGEFQHFLAGKADMPDLFLELEALLLLTEERSSCGAPIPAQVRLTIFDSSGIATQDAMITKLVLEDGKTM